MSLEVIVTGPPRSGTSFLTGMIRNLGYNIGPDNLLVPPNQHNPRGYFEFGPLNAISDQMVESLGIRHVDNIFPELPENWPEKFQREKEQILAQVDRHRIDLYKDNDLVILADLYDELFPEAKWIFISRNVEDTFKSRFGTPIPFERWKEISESRIARWRKSKPSKSSLELQYEDFVNDPRDAINRIGEHLERDLDESQILSCLESFQRKDTVPVLSPDDAKGNSPANRPSGGSQHRSNQTATTAATPQQRSFGGQTPLVSIVILNRDRLKDLQICLESIRRFTTGRVEVIVIDNCSSDGSAEYLRTLKDIVLQENTVNLGCPQARHQAMALANGDYVVFLDNDTIVTPSWLTTFLAYANAIPDLGMLGPRSNYVSGPQLVQNVPYKDPASLVEFSKAFCQQNRGKLSLSHRLVGFCTFVTRQLIDKIGAHDPGYGRFGFEDDDYSWRASIAGFKVAIAHDVFIHHTGGPQTKGDAEYNQRLMEAWSFFKNKWGMPADLQYGQPYDVKAILSQPFDRKRHYIPIPDRSQVPILGSEQRP